MIPDETSQTITVTKTHKVKIKKVNYDGEDWYEASSPTLGDVNSNSIQDCLRILKIRAES